MEKADGCFENKRNNVVLCGMKDGPSKIGVSDCIRLSIGYLLRDVRLEKYSNNSQRHEFDGDPSSDKSYPWAGCPHLHQDVQPEGECEKESGVVRQQRQPQRKTGEHECANGILIE